MNTIAGSCLLGVMIGDAYGAAVERKSGFTGRYTDDTQMTLAIAEALVNEGLGADPAVVARYMAEHFDPARGYGGNAGRILADIQSGTPWHIAATKHKPAGGSWGNGAAARVAPIGLLHNNCEDVMTATRRYAAITGHTHPEAIHYATLQALSVMWVSRPRTTWSSAEYILSNLKLLLANYNDDPQIVWVLNNLDADPAHVAVELGCGVRAKEAVPCALWAFLSTAREGPMEVVKKAAAIGGDSDTIASMAGALAGACYSQHKWPKDIVDQLENGRFGRDFILSIAKDITEVGRLDQSRL